MWTEAQIIHHLKIKLGTARFRHVQGVRKAAEELSAVYHEDPQKAVMAALLHDVMKEESGPALARYMRVHGEEPGNLLQAEQVLHAPAGAIFARVEAGVADPDVLNAIRYHTTGRPGMSRLEKIIFLADLIEDGRHHEGVDALRVLAREDLDRGMFFALNENLKFLASSNAPIILASVEARNYYRTMADLQG